MVEPGISRRALIGWAGAAAAGLALPAVRDRGLLIFHSPDLPPFVDELPRLPVLTGTTHNLDAAGGTHRFHRDLPQVPTFRYLPVGPGAGSATGTLGPVIEAERGLPTTVALRNALPRHPFAPDVDPTVHGALEGDRDRPRTVLHLHGGVTAPRHDGHPMATVDVGAATQYRFGNDQQAAALWYHDHAMGMTRLNVAAGLAAPYLVRDEWDTGRADNPLGLPAGEFELPMVLQEKFFDDAGRVSVRSTPVVTQGHWEGGAVGDVGLVNGVVWPRVPVARGWYRLRLYNAGSYSVWRLFLSPAVPFVVIGNDGGLLDTPVTTQSLRLAPAERVDVLVDFGALPAGSAVELRNDEEPPAQAADLGERAMPRFCRFDVTAATGHRAPPPARLRGGPGRPPPLPPVPDPLDSFGRIPLSPNGFAALPPGIDGVRTVTICQLLEARMPPALMNLNNTSFDPTPTAGDDSVDHPRQGTTEVWNLVNTTPDPHPIHLHLVTFRILGRQPFSPLAMRFGAERPGPFGTRWSPSPEPYVTGPGRVRADWEAGPKDTVRVDGHTVTRVLVRFPTAQELGFDPDAAFDLPGGTGTERGYVYHCHVLDHEDHEMMQRYRLLPR